MAWTPDNTTGMLTGLGGLAAGAGLTTAGIMIPGLQFLIPLGLTTGAGGIGTMVASGLDTLSEDPEEIPVPYDIQQVVDAGNQRDMMNRLLAGRMAALQGVGDSYLGNPYARPTMVGKLTGDARSVDSGLGQLQALSADDYTGWVQKRDQARRSVLAALLGMNEKQQQLGNMANDSYWKARKLQEDVRRGNVDNQLARDQLRADRIRVGAGIGAKLGELAGSSGMFKPGVEVPPTNMAFDSYSLSSGYTPTPTSEMGWGGWQKPRALTKPSWEK